jgi:hypothetical protein
MSAFEQWAAARGCALIALATRRAAPFYRALGYEESATYFCKVPDSQVMGVSASASTYLSAGATIAVNKLRAGGSNNLNRRPGLANPRRTDLHHHPTVYPS